jgi:hypothetical protein
VSDEQPNAYEIVLADLIAKRNQLDAAIAAIKGAMGAGLGAASQVAISPSNGAPPQIRADEFFGMTVLDGAKKYLTMMKRPQSSQTITEALQQGGYLFSAGNPVATVASVLNREDGKPSGAVVRIGKGTFGLAEWYPNRPRRKRANGDTDTADQEQTGDEEKTQTDVSDIT